ncbi:hypothetical protein C8R45DRAFT_935636 [Mycena sanguinolenta]|nr:hypothetical protein C8R45DRAFT_935636 [Mycena sanguinolenta]
MKEQEEGHEEPIKGWRRAASSGILPKARLKYNTIQVHAATVAKHGPTASHERMTKCQGLPQDDQKFNNRSTATNNRTKCQPSRWLKQDWASFDRKLFCLFHGMGLDVYTRVSKKFRSRPVPVPITRVAQFAQSNVQKWCTNLRQNYRGSKESTRNRLGELRVGGLSGWQRLTQLSRMVLKSYSALVMGSGMEFNLECTGLFAEAELSSEDICSAEMNPVNESVLGSHSESDAGK